MALKDLIQSNYVTVLYSVASSLSFSPLNEIMKHSNTALWTIPKFDFGDIYQYILEIQKNLFTFSNCPDPDQRAHRGAL